MPPPIKKLADRFLTNPKYIEVARPASANVNIAQFKVAVPARKKRDVLRQLLQSEDVKTGIIFCNRKTTVREINKSLNGHGFSSGEIHGDMDQASRIAELQRFKDGKINILVASDVAARGLDVKGVSHVFNFDTPWHPDDYVHRIGRTGRAGALGRAFTFVAPEDAEAIANVEKLTGGTIPVYEAAGSVATADDAEAEPPKREKRARNSRRDEQPAREERPSKEKRIASAERPAREDRPIEERPRQEAQSRSPRRDAVADKPRHNRKAHAEEQQGGDDGWNGPVPSFLNVSALS